jgi:transposase-like protein
MRGFREGAVRLVRDIGKPVAEVACDLGIDAGALGNWVNKDRGQRGEVNRGVWRSGRGDQAVACRGRGVADGARRRPYVCQVAVVVVRGVRAWMMIGKTSRAT